MAVRLLQYSDLENAYDRPERIGRLAGRIAARRTDTALVVGTGDNTAPGVLSLVTEGRGALEFFSQVDPDLETLGNHDFDYGLAATRQVIAESPQTWVATNVYRASGGADSEPAGSPARFASDVGVAPTAIRTVADTTLGFVGLLAPETPEVSPTASDLVVTDPVAAARKASARLRERGVDHVVALSHLGRGDIDIARETDVEVILGGHVHSQRIERNHGTLMTRPGANATNLIELELADGEWSATRHDVSSAPVSTPVRDAFRDRLEATGLAEPVGRLRAPMARDRETILSGPARVGRFIAESYRWLTDADVGLQNSGGIRVGPALSGTIEAADLVSLVPFEEPVVVIELSGRALRDVLAERDGGRLQACPDDRWMGHASWQDGVGAPVPKSPEPSAIDPERIASDELYRLATSEYLRYTDAEFPTLTGREPVARTDRTQYEVLCAYARKIDLAETWGGTDAVEAPPEND